MSTQLSINEDLIQFLQKVGYRKDPLVDELEKETKALGKVAQMQIAKEQGQFLEIIVNISKATSCLEIGRFTGLSPFYMARGLSSVGEIVTVDYSDEFLPLAQNYWDKDGLTSKIESIIGAGVDVMQSLIVRQHTFDLIFVDADKNNYPNYYALSLSLVPSNGIIIIDNLLWHGDVADTSKNDSPPPTIRALKSQINPDDRVGFSLLTII
jgi:Predicted O-methyltransferase